MPILVYTTHASMAAAEKIAAQLFKKRLIACVNSFPIQSMYWWEGRVEKGKEVASIYTTRKSMWAKVRSEILKNHPYEVPCVKMIETKTYTAYGDWILAATKNEKTNH